MPPEAEHAKPKPNGTRRAWKKATRPAASRSPDRCAHQANDGRANDVLRQDLEDPCEEQLDPIFWNDGEDDSPTPAPPRHPAPRADGHALPLPSRAPTPQAWLLSTLRLERLQVQKMLEQQHRELVSVFSANMTSNNWELRALPSLTPTPSYSSPSTKNSSTGSIPTVGDAVAPPAARPPPAPEAPMPVDVVACRADTAKTVPTLSTSTERYVRFARDAERPVQFLLARGIKVPSWYVHFSRGFRAPPVETALALLILSNAVFMAFEAQYHGLEAVHTAELPGQYGMKAGDWWTGVTEIFEMADRVYGIIFTVELVLQVLAFHVFWPVFALNWLDLIIVVGWWSRHMGVLNMNPMIGRIIRLFRVARLVRLARSMSMFDSLRLMLISIWSSIPVAAWAAVVLLVVSGAGALIMNSFTRPYISDTSKNREEDRLQMFKYFGTFTRAWLTMIEITIGNWVPVTRFVQESIGEGTAYCLLTYQLIMGFSIVKVITGVFLQEVFKVAGNNDELMTLQKHREIENFQKKITALFEMTDTDGEGVMSYAEFKEALQDRVTKEWLTSMDLDVSDTDLAWEAMDVTGAGLTKQDFLDGVLKIKGQAKKTDMLSLKRHFSGELEEVASRKR